MIKIPFIFNWLLLLDLQHTIQHSPTILIYDNSNNLTINKTIIHK